jgi:predicted transcriptional regulator
MDLPQETMLWYVVPAIRRALMIELKARGLKQKEIAPLLGVTDAAVSQYMKDKRATLGKDVIAREPLLSEIRTSADVIVKTKDHKASVREINRICAIVRDKKIICQFHKLRYPNEKCNICYE